MSPALLEAILSYATIPAYVFGLLILVYIIAHFQLGFSLTRGVKQAVKAEVARERSKTPMSAYLLVMALFALLIGLAIISQRRP